MACQCACTLLVGQHAVRGGIQVHKLGLFLQDILGSRWVILLIHAKHIGASLLDDLARRGGVHRGSYCSVFGLGLLASARETGLENS